MITTISLSDVPAGAINLDHPDNVQLLTARDRIAFELLKVIISTSTGQSLATTYVDAAFRTADAFISKANEQEKEND